MHVPQPEVQADDTNPKGFGEPQWVVDFHDELLKRCNVQVSDARPSAWFEAGKLGTFEPLRQRLRDWLEPQFAEGPELVVKDPRLSWFLGLWRSAALRCDASPAYVTMLRPVTEVVGSKQQHYGAKFGEVNRTAAWVNMMLHTERATRGSARAFVRYGDLLKDWTVPLFGIGQQFDLASVQTASANDIRAVHAFVDPNLRRVQLTWDDIEVPPRLREIAEESWQGLDRLADPGGDTPEVHDLLDELRTAYADLYDEAEAIAQSTALAAHRDGLAQLPAPTTTRRGVDKVPHGVRADGAGECPPRTAQGVRAGAVNPPSEADIPTVEGLADYDVTWPWREGKLPSGLTCVFRVKNEARNLPWVLPPMFEAVQHVVLVDNGSDDGTLEVARATAEKVGALDRLTATTYPFQVSRAGAEHLATPPDSVHSLTHFYNWSFSHVRTNYSMKWDGDMVLTREGVGTLADLSWQLEDSNAVVAFPRHPLTIESESVAWIDLGFRFLEPWVYPMGPEFTFVKAFEWEVREFPSSSERIIAPEGMVVELKWLDTNEFAHWTSTDDFESSRAPRKRREWEVYSALSEGRGEEVQGLHRIEAPPGVHVIDHVTSTWLPQAERPLVRRPGRLDV